MKLLNNQIKISFVTSKRRSATSSWLTDGWNLVPKQLGLEGLWPVNVKQELYQGEPARFVYRLIRTSSTMGVRKYGWIKSFLDHKIVIFPLKRPKENKKIETKYRDTHTQIHINISIYIYIHKRNKGKEIFQLPRWNCSTNNKETLNLYSWKLKVKHKICKN